jgi:uncharacterized protein YndB with AHSA1/START domain
MANGSAAKANELRIVRVYDAPVKAVWEAWTDPAQVAQWWGPRGFTITTHSKDLRPGGHWRYTMHGPDGTDWPNTTQYLEVEKEKKLVYDHGGSDDRPALFRVTVLFSEVKGGKTRMEMTMATPTAEGIEHIRQVIKKASGNSTWDRLAEYVEKEQSGREVFVIARRFEAAIDKVFEMWTVPGHFAKWIPPAGASMEFIEGEIRPGGGTFYCMVLPGGERLYGRTKILEMERSADGRARLVYTQEIVDKEGKVAKHPKLPVWPEVMLTTVEMEEDAGGTRVVVRWEPTGEVKREEVEMFVKIRAGMTAGWTGSFDKLEEALV